MVRNFYNYFKPTGAILLKLLFLFLCLFWPISPIVKSVDNLLLNKSSVLVLSSEINQSQPFDFLFASLKPIEAGQVIGFKVGTYGRKLECRARIISSIGAMTDWGLCPTEDWGMFKFNVIRNFSKELVSYKLETDAQPGAGFALGRIEVEGGSTLDLRQLVPRSSFFEIWKWIGNYPIWAIPWAVLFIFFLKNCYFRNSRLTAIYVVVLMAVGTWPFSGHDETAHITGLHWSGLVAAGKSLAEVENAQKTFFPKVHEKLKEFKFEELHGVKLADPESCPHSFLMGGCSYDPESKTFSTYLNFWKLIGSPDVSNWSPVTFLAIGRAFNIFLFLIFAYLITHFFPSKISESTLASLVLCGSFLGQVGSINPEQFGYYSALFCALFFACFFEQNRALRLQSFFGFSIFGILALLADNSGLLFIPTFTLVAALTLLCKAKVFRPLEVHSLSNNALWGIGTFGLFACFWFGFRYTYLNLDLGFSKKIAILASFKHFQNFIDHAFSLSFKETGLGLLVFFKSFLGSYTWGHDYYPRMVYLLFFASIFILFLRSLSIRKSYRFDLLSVTAGFYFLSIIISMIAGASFHDVEIIKESFLKPRIYGPAMFPFFQLLIVIGITINDKYLNLLRYLGLYLVTAWLFSLR
jgi:hypothetical protein